MNMLCVTIACLLAVLMLIGDAESFALQRETRGKEKGNLVLQLF